MPVISTIAAATARSFGAFKSAAGGAADEFFKYVTLLLHGDGTNGAQNNTFLDSSTNNFTITRNGNTTQGTFSPFSQTGWSNYFDGSGDYLSVAHNAALSVLGSSFTMECWFYLTAAQRDAGLISKHDGSGGYILRLDTTFIRFFTTAATVDRTYSFAANTWYHVAIVSSGTTGTLYINGVAQGATFSTNGTNASSTVQIGRTNTITNDFPGYISNVRITNTAVYTSAFTPSTAPLTAVTGTALLTCQSNRFRDASTNNFAITVNGNTSVQAFSPFAPTAAYSAATVGGSGYFDGSGDYLTTPSSGQPTAAGDFTVSCWFYLTSFASSYYVPGGNWSSATSDEWLIQIQNNGAIRFLTSADGTFSSTGVVRLNEWTYFSATRSGSTVTVQVNGTTVRTYTKSDTLGSASKSINIGQQPGNNWPFNGYITDFRFVSGSAITAIPTAPATAISGTSLLTNFTNGGIIDNTAKNVLETVGNAQISTSVKKFGTGSLAFDGTGDYLKPSTLTDLAFGTGDFTIEFWLYLNTTATEQWCVAWTGPGTCTIYFNSGTIRWYANGGLRITGASLSATTWYHIALTRESGSTKLFVDGTQSGSTYSDTNSYVPTAYTIGASTTATAPLNGYIDDLRITKGVARYTANFTPPTAAFADQ
jgi:hypothetical protein